MASNPVVELVAVTKSFQETRAVDNISLTLKDGEFLALLGPSGCGKTTTLRMIAGFVIPDAGQIYIRGEDVSMRPPHKRNLGVVFQHFALFPHMTVADNVAFGLRARRVGASETRERVQRALDLVQMSAYGGRYPKQLSGGQQQRVALARAIVFEPQVLLLDEPLSSLDANLREQMRAELRDIQQRIGIAAIFVTHDQAEALTLADRLAVMNAGHVEQLGTPRDVYEAPRTAFVARFIGQTNLYAGTCVGSSGRCVEVDIGADTRVRADTDRAFAVGEPVFVGVKHQRVAIQPGPPPAGYNCLPVVIHKQTYLGSDVEYRCEAAGQELIAVCRGNGREFIPRASAFAVWAPGECTIVPQE